MLSSQACRTPLSEIFRKTITFWRKHPLKYNWKHGAPKVAFITGGGSGLGRQFAKLLLAEGASVALFDLCVSDEVLAELEALALPGQKVLTFQADITDGEAVERVVAEAVDALGAPDLALNSAGIAVSSPFETLSRAAFEKVVAVNLFGSRNFAAAVLPKMKPQSRLVLVASLAGKAGSFGYAAYNASKFGVVGLAECLRVEQKLRGVDVSVLCPGEIATPLVEEEAKTIHPIARAIKDTGGTLEVGEACDAMLRDVARGRFTVIPGFKSRMTHAVAAHFPSLLRNVIDAKARKVALSLEKAATAPAE
jgi:NAD(P)-dependent dehydrogenase (short-subunit alcohol dehydrogenase family)